MMVKGGSILSRAEQVLSRDTDSVRLRPLQLGRTSDTWTSPLGKQRRVVPINCQTLLP